MNRLSTKDLRTTFRSRSYTIAIFHSPFTWLGLVGVNKVKALVRSAFTFAIIVTIKDTTEPFYGRVFILPDWDSDFDIS